MQLAISANQYSLQKLKRSDDYIPFDETALSTLSIQAKNMLLIFIAEKEQLRSCDFDQLDDQDCYDILKNYLQKISDNDAKLLSDAGATLLDISIIYAESDARIKVIQLRKFLLADKHQRLTDLINKNRNVFHYAPSGVEESKVLLNFLQSHPENIHTLSLRVPISPEVLFEILNTYQSIRLELFYETDDNHATALAQELKFNTTLTSLETQNTIFGQEGAKAFAEALRFNSTLTSLCLSNVMGRAAAYDGQPAVEIGFNGFKAICDTIKTSNTTLTHLILNYGAITPDIINEVDSALRENKTVKRLNGIAGSETNYSIQNHLKTNQDLAELEAWATASLILQLSVADKPQEGTPADVIIFLVKYLDKATLKALKSILQK